MPPKSIANSTPHNEVIPDDKASKSVNPNLYNPSKPLENNKFSTVASSTTVYPPLLRNGSEDGAQYPKPFLSQQDKAQRDNPNLQPKRSVSIPPGTLPDGTSATTPVRSSTPVRNRRGSFFTTPHSGTLVSPRTARSNAIPIQRHHRNEKEHP